MLYSLSKTGRGRRLPVTDPHSGFRFLPEPEGVLFFYISSF